MLSSLAEHVQTNDFADLAATRALAVDLESDFATARSAGCALCIMASHAQDEEKFVFPGSASFANALVTSLIAEHHELTRQELEIVRSTHELLGNSSPDDRIRAGIRISQAVNRLVVGYLTHMNREEEELVPAMKEHLTNPQMLAMRGGIIAGLPPDRLRAILGWMLPSLNVNELVDFIGGVRSGAPPPLVKMVTDLGEARVEPARWGEVRRRLGL